MVTRALGPVFLVFLIKWERDTDPGPMGGVGSKIEVASKATNNGSGNINS